jgi:hypothetical protein
MSFQKSGSQKKDWFDEVALSQEEEDLPPFDVNVARRSDRYLQPTQSPSLSSTRSPLSSPTRSYHDSEHDSEHDEDEDDAKEKGSQKRSRSRERDNDEDDDANELSATVIDDSDSDEVIFVGEKKRAVEPSLKKQSLFDEDEMKSTKKRGALPFTVQAKRKEPSSFESPSLGYDSSLKRFASSKSRQKEKDESKQKDEDEEKAKAERQNAILMRMYEESKAASQERKEAERRYEENRRKAILAPAGKLATSGNLGLSEKKQFVGEQPSVKDNKNSNVTGTGSQEYDKLNNVIIGVVESLRSRYRNHIKLSDDRPVLFDAFVVGLANISRQLADNNSVIFKDERENEKFRNNITLDVFKKLAQPFLSRETLVSVAASVPEEMLASGLVGSKGFVLSVLRGIPVDPTYLNPKRKIDFVPSDWQKLKPELSIKTNKDQKGDEFWNVSVKLPNVVSSSITQEALEKVKKMYVKFDDDPRDVNVLDYIQKYETNPKVFNELLEAARKRNFELESRMVRHKRRMEALSKMPKSQSQQSLLGSDLINQIGDNNAQKMLASQKPISESNSLFAYDNDDVDEAMEQQIKEAEENIVIAAQPEALSFSEYEEKNDRERDGQFLKRAIKTIAKISRLDAENEMGYDVNETNVEKQKAVTQRAQKIFAVYLFDVDKILPLSEHYYDSDYVNMDLTIKEIIEGKTIADKK